MKKLLLCTLLSLALISLSCTTSKPDEMTATPLPSRESKIPPDAVKINPADDPHPPILHAEGWEQPVPLPGPVNTAGGEDAPFIPASGGRLFFFFTPDVSVPAEKQLVDGVTGIYLSQLEKGTWGAPRRIVLSDDLALDGCPFALRNQLWFCSIREGTTGPEWFTATFKDSRWQDWQKANFNPSYQVGELHISADEEELYYHADRAGSLGENDIWVSKKKGGVWGEPMNLSNVNSPADDSRPYLTPDGQQLWFTRSYQGTPAIFMSAWEDGAWGTPTLILSQFAGEPTLDKEGNVYFVHHFFREEKMLEADIYVAYKKVEE